MSTALAPSFGAPAFSPGAATAAMLRAWWRNALPLVATALLVSIPGVALRLIGSGRPGAGLAYELLTRAIDAIAWLIGAGALAAGGLEALRGQRLRPLRLVLRGLAAAWRLLLALLRAFRLSLALGVLLAAGWVLVGLVRPDASILEIPLMILMMALTAAFLVSTCVTAIWVFPLPAVVLECPRDGIRQVVRRTLELTWERRLRLFAFMAIVLAIAGTLNVSGLFLRFGGELPVPAANAAVAALDALGASLTDLAPAAAYLLLARDKYGPSADQLGLVFE